MYALTKMDLAAFRQADYLYVSLIGDKPRVCATNASQRKEYSLA